MAPSTSWRGALDFAGFPVNVRLYGRVKSRSSDSFKTIAPNGLPVRSVYLDTEGDVVPRDKCRKGVPAEKDTYIVLTPEGVASIQEAKSTVVDPRQFCPRASLPLELAINAYAVIPDKDSAGADRSASILWNGLLASDMAYVTDLVMTGGGRDAILAVYATEDGLWAATLPYAVELNDVPTFDWVKDDQVSQVFGQALDRVYRDQLTARFDHGLHVSEYRQRRQAAIEAALDGTPVAPARPQENVVPDLMAALMAAVREAPHAPTGPRTPPARTKTTEEAKV